MFYCFKGRDLVLYCSQEKEAGALLFSGEGTGALCLCFEEKGTGVVQFS